MAFQWGHLSTHTYFPPIQLVPFISMLTQILWKPFNLNKRKTVIKAAFYTHKRLNCIFFVWFILVILTAIQVVDAGSREAPFGTVPPHCSSEDNYIQKAAFLSLPAMIQNQKQEKSKQNFKRLNSSSHFWFSDSETGEWAETQTSGVPSPQPFPPALLTFLLFNYFF